MSWVRNAMTRVRSFPRRFVAKLKDWAGSVRTGFRNFLRAPGATTINGLKALGSRLTQLLVWLLLAIPRMLRWIWRWFTNLTVWTAVRTVFYAAAVLAVIGALVFFFLIHYPNSQIPEYEPADAVVYLGQGWGPSRDSPDRQLYYYTPQGTGWALKNMRYSWFVNLELPWGKRKFADPDRMRAYGFLVDTAPTEANPDWLPVGFAKHYDPNLDDEVLDITCAACHTGGLLARQDDGTVVAIRIDGGQAMHAFTAMAPGHFGPVLLGSMASTYLNPIKFNRFARNVLGEEYYKEGKSALRQEFKKTLLALLATGANEKKRGLAPTEEGFGRTDAIARIANVVFGDHLDPANYHIGDAPVSYPPVWDIWKFDWVQYGASVAQPMARNLGESLGVGTTYRLMDTYERPLPVRERFDTTTMIEELHEIELTLRKLRPPVWPEELLGQIDIQEAVNGGILYIKTCQGCHGPRLADPRQKAIEAPLKTADDPHWRVKTLPIQDIGTDPKAAVNFVRNTYDLTKTGLSNAEIHRILRAELDQERDRVLAYDHPGLEQICGVTPRSVGAGTCAAWDADKESMDDVIEAEIGSIDLTAISVGQGLNYVGLLMREKLYRERGYDTQMQQTLNGFGALDLPQVILAYKARPLAGAWATPPYLHNGSVPNLYQLLSPAHERDTVFFIGRREFDPIEVGFRLEALSKGGFWYDTTQPGNSNTGHEFRSGYKQWEEGDPPQYGVIGPEYSDEQRLELIEYLKTHLDDPPHSALFTRVFAGILAAIRENPDTFATQETRCNLSEYLMLHENAPDLSATMKADITAIRAALEIDRADYFIECRMPWRTRYE